ncbi:MAG: DUF5777 family beta-barrel protein [Bacteroidota bacterium]
MTKKIYLLILFSLFTTAIFAQNEDTNATEPIDTIAQQKAEGKKAIQDAWGSTMLIDAQTSLIPTKGSMELVIQHRFSNLNNGIHDLFGLYGASNIRLAFNYSIFNQWMIGFSTEKDNKYQEFFTKVKLLEQNRKGSIPLSLTLFGNATIGAREKAYFGIDYKFIDRMSYFAQLIVARKFCKVLSLEAAVSYSHYNKVESQKVVDTLYNTSDSTLSVIQTRYDPIYQNDVLGVSGGARINFYKGMSLLLEYDQGFYLKKAVAPQLVPKPNLGIAFEITTSTHCFQIFASNYRGIIPQHNFSKSQFDFATKKGWMLGFNITVRFN